MTYGFHRGVLMGEKNKSKGIYEKQLEEMVKQMSNDAIDSKGLLMVSNQDNGQRLSVVGGWTNADLLSVAFRIQMIVTERVLKEKDSED